MQRPLWRISAFLGTLLAAAVLAAAITGARAAAAVLLGDQSVEAAADQNPAGQAEAFPFTAHRSGRAHYVRVYVASANRASQVLVALYAGRRGHPGRRISTGTERRPRRGAWNFVRIRSVRLTAHRQYWLAVLGRGGRLAFRDRASGTCRSHTSAQRRLRALPSRWRTAKRYATCPISAYVATSRSSGSAPGRAAPAPGPTPQPGPAPSPPAAPQTHCVAQPSACGYPDASNSGVPAGTALAAHSGDVTISTPGTVISGWKLTNGTITVKANNVTVQNSVITTGDGQLNGQSAIDIADGVSGTTVRNVTMQGTNCQGGSLFAGVMNEGGDGLLMDRDYGSCLDDILHGSGTIQNSYSIDNANIPNDHYEPVADDGGNGSLTVNHDTFLNPHDQVAAVFTQCTFGPITALTIENSLLAGGDYAIYGPLSDSCSNGGGTEAVTGNRFATNYWPQSGQYGVAVYFAKSVAWSNNYWDDTLKQIPRPS